ncbi:MAG: GNAT family N-acetyltransferase [Candidatus Heimdallarchaeota archaeon]|nr:GNAT family N-acetyltransferase [Candidatus Heimdallarchaeota archaeon]
MWFTKLNLEIHKQDPIFKKANESLSSRLKFNLSFFFKLLTQYRFVIKDGKKVAGALSLEKRKISMFIYAVGVVEEFRKKGFGTKLMDFAEEYAKRKNRQYITFSVLLDNKPAISLYHKLNYRPIGVGLTLIRFFTWKLKPSLKITDKENVEFKQLINYKKIHEKTLYWWHEEIKYSAGEEAKSICKKDALIDFKFKLDWIYYEILINNIPSGIIFILPSDLFNSIVLFSNSNTWEKQLFLQLLDSLSENILQNNIKANSNSTTKTSLQKTSMIQIFLTHQHKDAIINSFSKDLVMHDTTEDRQIYFKKIN